uniref:GDNF family receptor alpha-2 n=1 Tax=Mus musculus TaxID=10090 RepID=A0A2I3BQ61_MOUSE
MGSAWVTGSRLADFHANCRASYRTITSCPADNYQACLGSYAGMIGFDMTPNYVDSNPTGIVVSPWCNCRGSGNMEEECEKFLKDFTENPCLRNAIQAFGNGTDVNMSPKGPTFSATQAPRVEKTPSLPDDLSDSTSLGTSVITTCTSIQEQGLKANNSKELSMCFTELTTNISPGSKKMRPCCGRNVAVPGVDWGKDNCGCPLWGPAQGFAESFSQQGAGLATRTLSPLPLGFKDGNGLLPSLSLMGPSGSESGVGTPRVAPGRGACSMVGLGAVTGRSFFGEQASLGWVPAPRCSFLLHARNLEVKKR